MCLAGRSFDHLECAPSNSVSSTAEQHSLAHAANPDHRRASVGRRVAMRAFRPLCTGFWLRQRRCHCFLALRRKPQLEVIKGSVAMRQRPQDQSPWRRALRTGTETLVAGGAFLSLLARLTRPMEGVALSPSQGIDPRQPTVREPHGLRLSRFHRAIRALP